MKEISIKSIRLKIGDKIVDLTLEQAKELRECLNSAFGQPIVISSPTTVIERQIYTYPVNIPSPSIWPNYPSWSPIVTCGTLELVTNTNI